jgi:hypothetical protein
MEWLCPTYSILSWPNRHQALWKDTFKKKQHAKAANEQCSHLKDDLDRAGPADHT